MAKKNRKRNKAMAAAAAEQQAKTEAVLPPPPVALVASDTPVSTVTVSEREASIRAREDAINAAAAELVQRNEAAAAQLAQAAQDLEATRQARTLAQQRQDSEVASASTSEYSRRAGGRKRGQLVDDEDQGEQIPELPPPSSGPSPLLLVGLAVAAFLLFRGSA